jgi:hypothetical protein
VGVEGDYSSEFDKSHCYIAFYCGTVRASRRLIALWSAQLQPGKLHGCTRFERGEAFKGETRSLPSGFMIKWVCIKTAAYFAATNRNSQEVTVVRLPANTPERETMKINAYATAVLRPVNLISFVKTTLPSSCSAPFLPPPSLG